MKLISKKEAAERIAEAERVAGWVCILPTDSQRANEIMKLVQICKQFVLNDCVDPHHNVVPCMVCGADVHTCEKDDETAVDGDYRCPVHPDGYELANGEWVCSDECGEKAENPEFQYIDVTLGLAIKFLHETNKPGSFVEWVGHYPALLFMAYPTYLMLKACSQVELRRLLGMGQ